MSHHNNFIITNTNDSKVDENPNSRTIIIENDQ
jgi:hypothetical protein